MTKPLAVSCGQYSDKGRKDLNQDSHGFSLPPEPALSLKGIAIGLADGISSSPVSQQASAMVVRSFLEDYYCTSEAWSVQKSGERVLTASNSWLYSETMRSDFRFDRDRGYVCTFSGLIIKANTAHLFHVGDSRVYRLRNHALEQLTNDHRMWESREKSYLSRAMGMTDKLEIDYRTLPVQAGDVFVLATDGIYEFIDPQILISSIATSDNLDHTAHAIAEAALVAGSDDNLTIQILRVDALAEAANESVLRQVESLPLPPPLEARMLFDGYRIVRQIHASPRSHVFLAIDGKTGQQVAIKTPSTDQSSNPEYLERFMMEEWIARRLNSPHVLKPFTLDRRRNFLYTTMEYVEGKTLSQWLVDNPRPELENVRNIIEQVARGLMAFHRMEMLYQDLKPDNIMIDNTGTVKIIDFGAVRVAGLMEMHPDDTGNQMLGTALYMAPEYFLGEPGTVRSDLFSLAVLTYHMLTGQYPYGTEVARHRSETAQRRLHYRPLIQSSKDEREIPAWIDFALRKATQINPYKRHAEISEFLFELRQPAREFLTQTKPPLMQRNPVGFWQGVSLLQLLVILWMLYERFGH
ncbi:bifunctional protein-serine/threonine kinase/phosphatase [Parathalassolituus penaei]|uniref:Bifunctional protein-serine/threonine kinase/phosphatase n=1 Tax=Parathalassolituus penaei TaxID=2997323 RepID=A0A9X3EE07_9GAMM|nr:bifunctional protein-serine/threonine kinase/phosphatase [Parathalassolituus penaei]MCY0965868.1 bifunctional protein-serine/threonine kinase/phosphatase [Parathalassolituus penaei]